MEMRLLSLGDAAFTIEFPELSGASGAGYVRAVRKNVQAAIDQNQISGIVDLISATRSLTVCTDPISADPALISDTICEAARNTPPEQSTEGALWNLPVCYAGEYALDLEDVARMSGLSMAEVVLAHSDTIYDVLLIGFLPGFPFMGEVTENLRLARRTTPRTAVPAGSVAIANDQTAIYPWISPGGWHILGRCAVPLFDSALASPALLSPGDRVRFLSVTMKEFDAILSDLNSGNRAPVSFAAPGGL